MAILSIGLLTTINTQKAFADPPIILPDASITDPFEIENSNSYPNTCTAIDGEDGIITCSVDSGSIDTSVLGFQSVTYTATDSLFDTTTLTVTTTIVDTTPPIITPNAITSPFELELADSYFEGCTSTDNDPSYIDICSVDSGSIDTSVLGLQSVTYIATDPSGNTATSTLTPTIVDTTSPTLTLNGIDPETVFITGSYSDAGATVSDNDNSVDGTTIACDDSAVDTGTAGSYTVFCDFTDPSGNSATTVTRTVNVVDDIAPVITLLGSDPQTIIITDPYVELGATASDVNDGDITELIVIDASLVDTSTVGSYPVTYDVTDSAGNPATTITRTVNVIDTIIPVITLLGDPIVDVPFSSGYIDAGATATDINDGDITGSIVVTFTDPNAVIQPTLDTTVSGAWIVSYDVMDTSGNSAVTVTRTVNVGLQPTSGGNPSIWDSRPTFGKSNQGNNQIVEDGFSMDAHSYKLTNNWWTPFEKVTVNTGETHSFGLKAYSTYGIKYMKMAFVPKVGKMADAELVFQVTTDCSGHMISSDIFQKAKLVDDSQTSMIYAQTAPFYTVKINNVKFLDIPFYQVVGLEAVSCNGLVQTTFLNEGIGVEGQSFVEQPTVQITSNEKTKYGESGLMTLTRTDKFNDIWIAKDGSHYTKNQYNSWFALDAQEIQNDNTEITAHGFDRDSAYWKTYMDGQTLLAQSDPNYKKIYGDKPFAEINNIVSHKEHWKDRIKLN